MTFDEYIDVTKENVRLALKNYSRKELEGDRMQYFLSLDGSVTGASVGRCLKATEHDYEYISQVVFDSDFLVDVQKYDIDMTVIFDNGPECIDVLARSLALAHIDTKTMIEEELEHRKKVALLKKEAAK